MEIRRNSIPFQGNVNHIYIDKIRYYNRLKTPNIDFKSKFKYMHSENLKIKGSKNKNTTKSDKIKTNVDFTNQT